MEIKTIQLRHALPHAFRGLEDDAQLCNSQVWLQEIDFIKGRNYLLEAESGAGKSSLCSYLYGQRRDYDGQILFDGHDISTFSIGRWCQLRRTSLALLPQEMRIFPELTVMENILLKNRLTDFATEHEIVAMLEALEIDGKRSTRAAFLSIGQQQRVAIVRTLCQPYQFLLLDEPVSHLDRRNNRAAATMILESARRQGAAIIATSVGNSLAIEAEIQRISL